MNFRHLSARGLAGVLTAGLLVACTPDAGPDPSTTPVGSPSASASSSSTETAEEKKQREAFEAAEKAYRANWSESGRLSIEGGAEDPTPILTETSMGQYLTDTMSSLRAIKKNGLRASGPGVIAWVRNGAYSKDALILHSCEDFRTAVLRAADGDVYTPDGTRVYDQTITVKWADGMWKLSDQETAEVSTC